MPTYEDTLKYLDSFVNYERVHPDSIKKEFDLGKLREVLGRMGDPHRDYRCVHVAGTKGKGSICTFTSSILEAAGYRVGLFTSPHLITHTERIRVNGRIIGKDDLVRAVSRLREYIGPADKEFSFFEVYTLLAMLHFSMKKVDFAVFEVGLGGRLDATNVIDGEVCGIGPVSYDHMQLLGNTLEEIAREKTGIIKKGAHCVCSPQHRPVLRVIRDKCAEEGASLSLVGKDITCRAGSFDEKGSCFDVYGMKGRYEGCRTNMPGDFQVFNCATAVGICEHLLSGSGVREDTFKKGIERAFIPGRLEVMRRRPLLVIDGAHNGESAMHLKKAVERIFKYDRLILLLGLSQDKDMKRVCRELVPLADEIVLTRASVSRAADPRLIRRYIKRKSVKITENVKQALDAASALAGKNDMILATGSFFVIGEVRRIVYRR